MIPESTVSPSGSCCKPRASGDDPTRGVPGGRVGPVNPARAGMIRSFLTGLAPSGGNPRASGDDPYPQFQDGEALQ